MQLNDYLVKIQSDFASAKAKAEAVILPPVTRKPVVKTDSPDTSFNPVAFEQTDLGIGLDCLTALNPVSPANFDITRTTASTYQRYPLANTTAVVVDGDIQTCLPAKQVDGEICGIDWVNITMFDTTFDDDVTRTMTSEAVRHNALVKNISAVLENILGFGIVKQNKNGVHFYETSYQLEHNVGLIALGGQNNSVLIMINGTGCDYAKHGWRNALYAFLKTQAINPRITRLDLAHDDLEGAYSDLAWFAREYDKGGFRNGRKNPTIEMRGNWKQPDGKGRTLYIGSAKSGRYCRIYEKGKQLGQPDSKWVRTEVEYKAKGIFIDLEALISPSNFFAMTYPCFHVFDKKYHFEAKKFERIEREEYMTFAAAVEVTRHQFGRFIYAVRQEFAKRGLTDTNVLDLLTDIKNKAYPDRLDRLSIPDFFKPKPTLGA